MSTLDQATHDCATGSTGSGCHDRECGPEPARDRLLDGQNQALRLLARGSTLETVLETLVRGAETAAPGMIASILRVEDGRLRHGAAPSLPGWYCAAIDGVTIGPSTGSCGTAAFLRRRVVVTDIQSDPLWKDFRELAARAGLGACWSEPVYASDGTCLGTFAMYYATPKAPSPDDLDFIENAAQVAGIAIERSRTEARLQDAMERAESASLAKSAFLAHMSHELRTPLNAIIGFADIVDSEIFGGIGAKNRDYVRDIAGSGRHLLDIVTGLLELSRVEGADGMAPTLVDLELLTADVAGAFAARMDQKGIVFDRRIGTGTHIVMSDAGALRQLLTNLLDNAVKFTPRGGSIVLETAPSADVDPGEDDAVSVRITDSGSGIPADRLPHVRKAFHGGGGMTSRDARGIGIGLAIADRLASMLGATLTIESGAGAGTTVVVRLPPADGAGGADPRP